MMLLRKLTFVGTICILLNGCIIVAPDSDRYGDDWQHQQTENRQKINNLSLKMSREQVTERLGTANFSEAFAKGDDEFHILYYRTQRAKSDGETTKDETTPLVFKNNQLVGWGSQQLESVL